MSFVVCYLENKLFKIYKKSKNKEHTCVTNNKSSSSREILFRNNLISSLAISTCLLRVSDASNDIERGFLVSELTSWLLIEVLVDEVSAEEEEDEELFTSVEEESDFDVFVLTENCLRLFALISDDLLRFKFFNCNFN